MHEALERAWELLFVHFPGARYERRSDLVVWVCPSVPIPQVNGPWVAKDSAEAAEALAGAVAEVEAAGAQPWVQTRSGHDRTRRQALALGLSHAEEIPAMVVGRDDFVEARADVAIDVVDERDVVATNEILADCFGAPREVFDLFAGVIAALPEASWYVARAEGTVVSTAVGLTVAGATGIFNVATPPEHRRKGYGAAVTSRAVREGFEAGSRFAYLQSSDVGHGVYRTLGFRDVERYTVLTRPAGG